MYFYAFTMELKSNCFGLVHAKDLLAAIGIQQSEIDNCLQEGLNQIKAGNPPFEEEYPIDRAKMTEILLKDSVKAKYTNQYGR